MELAEPRSMVHADALENNARHAARFEPSDVGSSPARRVAVIACMDGRIRVEDILSLGVGDAHIIRNAGGLATDDAIRSLVISQHLLGTEEVIVMEHTGCGMLSFRDLDARRMLATRTGTDLDLPFLAFTDLDANLREQLGRIRSHPWIKDVAVHGLVYDIETGRLRDVR
jgi:carbonic anhydrase